MPKNSLLRFIAQNGVQVEEMPWGTHDWICRPSLTDAEKLMLVRVRMPAGQAHKFHRHPAMEEIIYVLSGSAEQWVDQDRQILGPGEAAHIPIDVVHGTYNAGTIDLVFLAILSPAIFDGPALVDVSQEAPWATLRVTNR
jgi:quercetin dioxygenase-like cupin family protein